jgi:hypothetical protein
MLNRAGGEERRVGASETTANECNELDGAARVLENLSVNSLRQLVFNSQKSSRFVHFDRFYLFSFEFLSVAAT